jgi:uncharacterized membrane protein
VDEHTDFTRIVAFTDGVFAIAITLLVLGFDVPQSDHEVTERVLDQWPQLLAYVFSFAVVGRFWRGHHRFFRSLERFDERLISLNLAYLSLIALVPFTTELLGEHGDAVVAPVAYAAVLGLASTTAWAMLRRTLERAHVADEHRPYAREHAARLLYTPAVFFASIPVAFLSVSASEWMWLLLLLQGRIPVRAETASS